MAKNIEPKLVSVKDYLNLESGVIFNIPEYQRPYSWDITRCEKLWNDICDYVFKNDLRDAYFFGTIIISCVDNDSQYDLVDGQQRTTTFILLLKAFLVAINDILQDVSDSDDDSKDFVEALKNRRKEIISILYNIDMDDISNIPEKRNDRDYYINEIIKNHSIREDNKFKEEMKNILFSYDFEETKNNVIKIAKRKNDNKYTNYFKNFKFFYNTIKELNNPIKLNSIIKTFLTSCEVIAIKSWKVEQAIAMFNSLNSDGMPLSDADLIVSSLYANTKDEDRDQFSQEWEELQNRINNLQKDGITDIDNIFNQYMYYKRTVNGDTKSKGKAIDVTVPGLRRYFLDESKIVQKPDDMIVELSNLVSMWESISDNTLVKILLRLNSNSKLFLASYLFRFTEKDIDLNQISEIVKCLIKLFVILEIGEVGYSSSRFKTFLFEEEIKFANKEINNKEIIDDFRNHINNFWKIDEIKDQIEDYYKHSLVPLNEYLFSLEKGYDFKFKSDYDVEHIMPSSSRYSKTVMKDAKIDSEEEFDQYVNKIGNKIALEKEINRSIGDNWFVAKLSINNELKNGYSNSDYPIAKYLVEKNKNVTHPLWTKEDIIEATNEASNRICRFVFE